MKIGDIVVNKISSPYVKEGAIGIVVDKDSFFGPPLVEWEKKYRGEAKARNSMIEPLKKGKFSFYCFRVSRSLEIIGEL